jgi:hypothetical protein
MQEEYAAQQVMLGAMVKGARGLELDGKWDAARAMLNDVKLKDSDYPYIMSMLGFVARHDGKPDEAIQDYESEVKHNREVSSSIVTELASLYIYPRSDMATRRPCFAIISNAMMSFSSPLWRPLKQDLEIMPPPWRRCKAHWQRIRMTFPSKRRWQLRYIELTEIRKQRRWPR